MSTVCVVVIFAVVSVVLTCSPEGYRHIDMDEMAFTGSIVAYGVVRNKFEHEIYPQAYSVEFEVKCSYKGGPLPHKINISNAGYIYGMCGEKNFTVGQEYIAFLSYSNGKYEQMYDDTMEAGKSMSELLTFCGLHLDYPSDGNNTNQCQDVQKEGCKQYIPKPPYGPPPPPPQKGVDPIFLDSEGSGEVSVSTTPEMKTESPSMDRSSPNIGMTTSKTESKKMDMTSSKMVTSKMTSAVATSSKKPTASTEVIIVPIVTPEMKDETIQSDYGAVNGGGSVTLTLFTLLLSACVGVDIYMR